MGKVISFRHNAVTAAADDWIAVGTPLVELIETAKHLCTDATPDAVLLTLAAIANHAGNAMTLNKQVLKTGYAPAIDDSIAALASRIVLAVPERVGRVHMDYVRFMLASCDALLLACARRRASRQQAAVENGQQVAVRRQSRTA